MTIRPVHVYADFQTGLEAYDRGDYSTALEEWEPLAQKGDASSQVNLGHLYANVRGVSKDYQQALHWFRLAAEQGVAGAQYNLGVMYQEGLGLSKDLQEALRWFRLAAQQDHVDAQYSLGILYNYNDGQDGVQDKSLATCWLLKAAKGYTTQAQQGNASAQYRLGILFEYGLGVASDRKEAFHWYHLAAEQGIPGAQYKVGYLYASGEGTTQDYLQAHVWANLAGANGYERAARLRGRIAANMSKEQVAIAQQLAKEWKPTIQLGNSNHVIPDEDGIRNQALGETQKPTCEPSPDAISSTNSPSASASSGIEVSDLSPPVIIESTLEGKTGEELTNNRRTLKNVPAQAASNREQYLVMVEEAIDRNWFSPPGDFDKPVVIVQFRIIQSGEVAQIHIEQSSGNEHYDSAALRAIQTVNPLPPFPSNMDQSFLDVKFRFIKTVEE